MFREKTIIRCRKDEYKNWVIKTGKKKRLKYGPGVSRLLRFVCTLLQHKNKIYSIDIIIKRQR